MPNRLELALLAFTRKREKKREVPPLLVELLGEPPANLETVYENYPFSYGISRTGEGLTYWVKCSLGFDLVLRLRDAVAKASASLDPREVEPLTFSRLIEVMQMHAAEKLPRIDPTNVKPLAEVVAYECIGLSRVLALAKDDHVTEFFTDSDDSTIYLDHSRAGRCDTTISLTERERRALETHLDTFRGYTLDFKTPSLKNDIEISGARLRVSVDLDPVAVNRFALDVRRLNLSSLPIERLIQMNVISFEASVFLIGWLEAGGNITIVGETGTGKTTLLNALDEKVEPKLRRLYIEDAVETRDLLDRGYHQMKVQVDPFERGEESGRTKESEIVKALHRSPDIVVLSEIQSEEHSRAFFQSLSAGAKGIQTFHASSIEQAIRRWVNVHHVPEQSLLDLGLLVQMTRPDKLRQERVVQRICRMENEQGSPRLRDLFVRDDQRDLISTAGDTRQVPTPFDEKHMQKMAAASRRIGLVKVAGI